MTLVFSVGNNPSTAGEETIQPTQTNQQIGQNQEVFSEKISQEELSKHNSKNDCWISYEGKVYDLTSFLPFHPGTSQAIEPFCGTSAEFESAFSQQHGQTKLQDLFREGTYKGELE